MNRRMAARMARTVWERKRDVTAGNRTGWVWGWLGRSGEWLTVPGAAGTAPALAARAPGATPPPAALAAELTLCQVEEVRHPGMTGPRGMAYRVTYCPPAEVAALALAMARLTERQVSALAAAWPTPSAAWLASANQGGWMRAEAAGIPRQLDWYRCRHAVEGWEPYGHPGVSYPLGYLAAAVACRDLLTAEAYATLTGWAAPHLAVPDRTAPAPART